MQKDFNNNYLNCYLKYLQREINITLPRAVSMQSLLDLLSLIYILTC